MDANAVIALVALIVGVAGAVVNWIRANYLFKSAEYPAVPWYLPECTASGTGTRVSTQIINKGPREAISVSFIGPLCCGTKMQSWCQYIGETVPTQEELTLVLTNSLEEDIRERFGGLVRQSRWDFHDKCRSFKGKLELSYLPTLYGAGRVCRTMYCEFIPELDGQHITGWRIKARRRVTGWLPWP